MSLTFTWGGASSDSKGLIVTHLPQPELPERRAQEFTVPGRSGDLYILENEYEPLTKTVTALIDQAADVDAIFAWLRGAGNVVFSDRATRAYRGRITKAVPLSWWGATIRELEIEWTCQPYSYQATPVADIVLTTSPNTVANIGNVESLPVITVVGTGNIDLTVNSSVIHLANVEASIVLDSEQQNAYKGTAPLNDRMTGAFPVLAVGNNTISVTGSVTGVTIKPNWRWLG